MDPPHIHCCKHGAAAPPAVEQSPGDAAHTQRRSGCATASGAGARRAKALRARALTETGEPTRGPGPKLEVRWTTSGTNTLEGQLQCGANSVRNGFPVVR